MVYLWDRESVRVRRLAFHEAGHAVALALCGEQWTSARVDRPAPEFNGWVKHASVGNPANAAFVAWAGSYAEARSVYERDDPLLWTYVRAAQEEGGRGDMQACLRYWGTPHEPVEQWAAELEVAWPQIRRLAARLEAHGVVYTEGGELF